MKIVFLDVGHDRDKHRLAPGVTRMAPARNDGKVSGGTVGERMGRQFDLFQIVRALQPCGTVTHFLYGGQQ